MPDTASRGSGAGRPTEVGPAALEPLEPVLVADRFAGLHAELIALLRGLRPEDWLRTTSAGEWTVRDVAAHLLDGDLRRISVGRDGHAPPAPEPIRGYRDLVRHLDRLNAEWVAAARRISPRLVTELLAFTGERVADLVASLDPDEPAPFGVAWAGQAASPNWLDVGREYTERWHHQDQIREAVAAPLLNGGEWLRPVVDISLRALPHAYRDTPAVSGDAVVLDLVGEGGGLWSLRYEVGAWQLLRGEAAASRCRVTVEAATAARLLLHRLREPEVRRAVSIEGDERLASPFLAARAVMV